MLIQFFSLPIRFYQWVISPLLPVSCRFQPSCSEYALQALRVHGVLRGSAMACKRIGRCHPWGGHGHDPVPSKGVKVHAPLKTHDNGST